MLFALVDLGSDVNYKNVSGKSRMNQRDEWVYMSPCTGLKQSTHSSLGQKTNQDPFLIGLNHDHAHRVVGRSGDDYMEEMESIVPFLEAHEDHGAIEEILQVKLVTQLA
jgi:hypothetical protein